MLYRKDRKGNELSQLGYGCMRFTKKGGAIDLDKAEAELMAAYEGGVNYFDTAYIYPGSEEALGKIVEKNGIRDKINIATKLPHYTLRTLEGVEKTFREELRRLRTDYIDYYLMHMFTDIAEWENLKKIGIEKWIEDRKAEGSIRNIGFSYHGDTKMFQEILGVYDWDFCQIQYNYLDENSQAGREGLRAAHEKGIPVIIMEPLRGGRLTDLPAKAADIVKASPRGYTAAEWGFRWLWDQEEVTVVLSGMNSLEMVKENLRTASDARPGSLTKEDHETISSIRDIIREKMAVGCTGCRYCQPCPKGVDIPGLFHYYNLLQVEDKIKVRFEFARNMGVRENPGFSDACISCGKCESHCPQKLPIRKLIKVADRALRPFPYRVGINVARRIMLKRNNF